MGPPPRLPLKHVGVELSRLLANLQLGGGCRRVSTGRGEPVPKSSGPVRIEKHLELDERTGVLDVHVLDVLAQVETLLRGAREIQRQILRVRGVPRRRSAAQRRAAAAAVRKTAQEMLEEAHALAVVLRDLRREADTLKSSADASEAGLKRSQRETRTA
jgi:hypothetical protein